MGCVRVYFFSKINFFLIFLALKWSPSFYLVIVLLGNFVCNRWTLCFIDREASFRNKVGVLAYLSACVLWSYEAKTVTSNTWSDGAATPVISLLRTCCRRFLITFCTKTWVTFRLYCIWMRVQKVLESKWGRWLLKRKCVIMSLRMIASFYAYFTFINLNYNGGEAFIR